MSARWSWFNVAPRYSPGSPALVSQAIAERVAADEVDFYRAVLEGVYGPDEVARAQQLGLDGIVEERVERHDGELVRDVITGRESFRLRREWAESSKRWAARVATARRRFSAARRVDTIDETGGAR